MTAKLQALGVIVLIFFSENTEQWNHRDPSRTWNTPSCRDKRKHCPKHEDRLGKQLPYILHLSNVLKHSTSPISEQDRKGMDKKMKGSSRSRAIEVKRKGLPPMKAITILNLHKLSPYLWPATTGAFVSSSTREKDNF